MGRPRKTSREGDIREMLQGSFAADLSVSPGLLDLDVALQKLTEDLGVTYVAFHRVGTHGGKLSIRTPKMYYMLTAMAPRDFRDRSDVDDSIYDDLKRQLESLS